MRRAALALLPGAPALPGCATVSVPPAPGRPGAPRRLPLAEHRGRFRPGLWIGGSGYADGRAVRPEGERPAGIPGLCVWGRGDGRSACPSMAATSPLTVVTPGGGRRFSGGRARVARVVVAFAGRIGEA